MDKSTRLVVTVAMLALVLPAVTGYSTFQSKIPNGDRVPHPCISGAIWQGVGHKESGGGGERNPFGVAFKANQLVWDRTFCMADSDGDGMSNGEELGDPQCQWTEGSDVTLRTTGLSHPGVCTPYNSDRCQGRSNFVTCEKFQCAAIDEQETFKYTVRIPETPVPAQETTYQCMPFEFRSDDEYHMVAFKPNIDNWNVMHHAIIYGCNDDADIKDSDINSTYNCFMGDRDGCNDFIAIWALGMEGFCYNDVAGLRVGLNGYKKAVLELHWNNPGKVSTYTDSSGFDFYLTKQLRANDAAVLMIGQNRINIPPQEERYTVQGGCPARCTQQAMTGNVNVISVFNHMHNLGHSVISQVRAPGQRVDYFGYESTYDYDSPIIHIHDPPIVVRPGDQLELSCTYNSMSRNTTTEFGLGTYDEMCFAFLTFYPAQNIQATQCVSNGIFEECEPPESLPIANGCDFSKVFDENIPEVLERYTKIPELCSNYICKKECKEYIKKLYQDPCYNEENRPYVKEFFFGAQESREFIREYWSRIESCNMEIARESVIVLPPIDGPTDAASRDIVNGLVVTCLLMIAMLLK